MSSAKDKKDLILSGSGKNGAPPPVEAANTLQTNHVLRLVEVLSEGPIESVEQVYLDRTPITDEGGDPNFEGVTVTAQLGTHDQTYLPGFTSQEADTIVDAVVTKSTPVVRTINSPDTDACRVVVKIPAMFQYDDKGNMIATGVAYSVQYRPSGGAWTEIPNSPFSWYPEKNTSPAFLSHRFNLTGSAPWDVRVVRISDDSTDTVRLQNNTYFYSIAEIIDQKITYRNTAILGIEADAQEFGDRVPERAALIKGRICDVPVNFDPVARTYSGVWNGTFKEAWTDDPAWCLRDIMTHQRYGLGPYISAEYLSDTTLYAISQYCGEHVPDGAGGTEPRFTFNAVLQTRREAYDLVNAMASVFRGMIYWSLGSVMFSQDSPSDPILNVVRANTVNGDLVYSGSAIGAVHNRINVTWNDPDNFYKRDIVSVEDAEHIVKYGLRPKDIIAFGCTSKGQAMRAGRWVLYTERMEAEALTYVGGQDHADVVPGSVVRVMDPSKHGVELGGRCVGASGTFLTLDREVVLDVGETYELTIHDKDRVLHYRTVVSAPGAHTTITVDVALPVITDDPKDTVWALSRLSKQDQLYRVLSSKEVGEHQYEVVALFHDPAKFSIVENNLDIPSTPLPLLPTGPLPVPYLEVTESISPVSGTQNSPVLEVHLVRDTDPRVRGVELQHRRKGKEWQTVDLRQNLSFTLSGVTEGAKYQFRARAYTVTGEHSRYSAIAGIRATGNPLAAIVPTVTNQTLSAGHRKITVSWDNPDITNLHSVEVWAGPDSVLGNATRRFSTPAESVAFTNLNNNQTLHVWLRVRSHANPPGYSNYTYAGGATTERLQADDIDDGSVTAAKLASGVVDDLATAIEGTAASEAAAAEAAKIAAEAARDAAQTAQTNSETARDQANVALTDAQTARDAAQTAQTAAEAAEGQAEGHATAANGSATAAAASETAAGASATAAEASSTSAATSASNAGASEAAAATSETNAAGSAAAASSSATTAASTLSLFNQELALTRPSKFINEDSWTGGSTTDENPLIKSSVVPSRIIDNDAVFGNCYEFANGLNQTVGPRVPVDLVDVGVYEVTATLRVIADGTTPGIDPRIGVTLFNATGADPLVTNEQWLGAPIVTVADGVVSFTVWFTHRYAEVNPIAPAYVDAVVDLGTYNPANLYIMPHVRIDGADGGAHARIGSFEVRDATVLVDALVAKEDASASASAAATSESAAAASETAAGLSASAATVSETNAATSAGLASTSATAASASETNAAGSATAASNSATVSARIEAGLTLIEASASNAGFEAGSDGVVGAPSGWETDSANANAFTTYLAYNDGVPNDTAHGSLLSFGSSAPDAGPWWRLSKYFSAQPGQDFQVAYRCRLANTAAVLLAVGSDVNFVDEDDVLVVFNWYDADGALLSRDTTRTASSSYWNDNNVQPPSAAWITHAPGARTAPANTKYCRIDLVAVDANGTVVATRIDYEGYAVGHAHVRFDDVVFGVGSGDLLEVSPEDITRASLTAAAATSAATATTKADEASASASAAQTSATDAATQASSASISASAAASSETNAAASAVASSASATDARALELSTQYFLRGAGTVSERMCLLAGTYQFAVEENGTEIFVNGVFDRTIDRGDSLQSIVLALGDIVTATKPFNASTSTDPEGVQLASYAHAGKYFAASLAEPTIFVQILPLAEGRYRTSMNTLGDGSLGSAPWASLPAGTGVGVELATTGGSGTLAIETDVPALVLVKEAAASNNRSGLLLPASERVVRTGTSGGNFHVTGSATLVEDGPFLSSDDLVGLVFGSKQGDGAGVDAEFAMPYDALGEEYILPQQNLSDYYLAADEDTEINVLDSFGVVLATHSLTVGAGTYADLQVGSVAGDGTNISTDGPFYITGTVPFYLRTNKDLNEFPVLGYKRNLRGFAAAGNAVASVYHASAAKTSATAAATSAGAASVSEVNAGNSEAAASASETASAGFAADASGFSVSAQQSQEVAARLLSKGVSQNPVLTLWDGAEPDGYSFSTTEGAANKITTGAKYVNAVELVTDPVPSTTAPSVFLSGISTSGNHVLPAHEVPEIIVTAEVELISGDWDGARIRGQWRGVSNVQDDYYFDTGNLSDEVGVIQTVSCVLRRPSGYTQDTVFDEVRVYVQASSSGSGGHSQKTIRVHSLDYQIIRATAEAGLYQSTRAWDEVQAAVIGMRTRAGGAAGEVELISLSDHTGASSLFKVSSDRMQFVGDFIDFFGTVEITGDLIVNGAISKRPFWKAASSFSLTTTFQEIFSARAIDFAAYELDGSDTLNPCVVSVTGIMSATSGNVPAWIVLQAEGRNGGGAWTDIGSIGGIDILHTDGTLSANISARDIDDSGLGFGYADFEELRWMAKVLVSGSFTATTASFRPQIMIEQISK